MRHCKNLNGHLLDINDEAESDFVATLEPNMTSWTYWTDGIFAPSHGVFKWQTKDEDVSYTNWLFTYTPPTTFQCLRLRKGGKWLNSVCEGTLPFVCEIPATPVPAPAPVTVPASSCDYTFSSSCYRVVNTGMDRTAAAYNCTSMGGHLIAIETEEEYVFVRDNIHLEERFHWSDAVYGHDGIWRWESSNEAMGALNKWRYGRVPTPNHRTMSDRYMQLDFTRIWWKAFHHWPRHAICELLLDQPAAPAPATCCEFKLFDSCYHYSGSDVRKTWQDASNDCQSHGGHLVTINSENENEYMDYITGTTSAARWSGGVYDVTTQTWKWSSSGEAITVYHWSAGVPDPSRIPQPTSESCMALGVWWQSYSCTIPWPYICEIEMGSYWSGSADLIEPETR